MTTTENPGRKKIFTRRKFLACAGLGAVGFTSYASFIAPFDLEVGRSSCPTSKSGSAQPIQLLHLSDLHASTVVSLDFIERAIDLGVGLKPDLICLTGDFITSTYGRFDDYARLLGKLSAAAPTFACLGNHDGGWWGARHGGYSNADPVRRLLQAGGITLLEDRYASISIQGRAFTLIGLRDGWSERVLFSQAFPAENQQEQGTRIVLAHNPDMKDQIHSRPWDLMLSGHTHGGQVVLPLLGPGFFAPVKDKRYVAGMLPWGERWIHVTRGIGNVHGVRFNCPPEVSLIALG